MLSDHISLVISAEIGEFPNCIRCLEVEFPFKFPHSFSKKNILSVHSGLPLVHSLSLCRAKISTQFLSNSSWFRAKKGLIIHLGSKWQLGVFSGLMGMQGIYPQCKRAALKHKLPPYKVLPYAVSLQQSMCSAPIRETIPTQFPSWR